MRYLPNNLLNHTIYTADTQAEVNMRILPNDLEYSCELLLFDMIMAIAPAIPSSRPNTFIFFSFSTPTITDSTNTIRGVVVLIIEPSMGDVFASPNIIHNLRVTPINIAAPKILSRSAGSIFSGFSHNRGANDHRAATTNDAETIAIGEMYFPSTRL